MSGGVCRDGCRLVNGGSWGGDGVMAHLHGFGSGSIDPVLVMFDCLILSVFSCWSVLGTNRWVCAWYNSWDLCLVQFTQSVPGTIHPICAWHNSPNLCLAQFTKSVPGTTAKYENALLFSLTTCIYMNRIIVYLVYTTGPLNDVSGYF
jgi:hypothetical protein